MRQLLFTIVALATLGGTAHAAPAPDRERAKEAYDRGLDAHKHGEMQRAADEFARADALDPSPIALQAALDAAIDADDVGLGTDLLERSKREPAPPGLASSITAAHIKFNGRAGRIRILCPRHSTCSAKVDETPAPVDKVAWAPVGQRTISVQVDGAAPQTKVVDIGTDQGIEVVPVKGSPMLLARPLSGAGADDPPPAAPSKESGGLPPVVVYAGVGLTLALAGVTTFFMVQTSGTHDDFVSRGCTRVTNAECADLSDSGKSSQSTANIALVFTAIAALTTGVIAVGFTNWRGGRKSGLAGPGGFAIRF